MKEIKLTIDGKEIQLTDEQLKALGFEPDSTKHSPFARVQYGKNYFMAGDHCAELCEECNDEVDDQLYNDANYFTDENFARQVALHQLLDRKLLKYAYDNEFEGTNEPNQYYVNYYPRTGSYTVQLDCGFRALCTHFSSYEACERAIKEVVKPFVAQYPEFKW